MSQNDNLLDLVNAVYRWRKLLIISCFLAAVLSTIAALILPNYYTSKTIFYAASPDLAKPLPIGQSSSEREIYGSDSDLDRLFSIANSGELTDYLINEFNLYERYEIDPSSDRAGYAVRLLFAKAFKTQKNKFDALELSFEDKDPEMAAKIAKSAREKINQIGQRMIKESQAKLLKNYEQIIEEKEVYQEGLINKLTGLKSEYKIFNSQTKGKILSEQLTSTKAKYANAKSRLEFYKKDPFLQDSIPLLSAKVIGLSKQLETLNKEATSYSGGSGEIEKLGMELKEIGEQFAIDKDRYKQLKSAYNSPFSALHLVQEAEVPHIKSRPIRWLIVVGTTAVTFFLALIWVLFMHQYKDVNWKSVFSDEKR